MAVDEDWLDGMLGQVEMEWLPERSMNQLGLVPVSYEDTGHDIPYFEPAVRWEHLPVGRYGALHSVDVLWNHSEGEVRRTTSMVEVGIGTAGQRPTLEDEGPGREDDFLPTLVEHTGFRCSSFLLVGTEDE